MIVVLERFARVSHDPRSRLNRAISAALYFGAGAIGGVIAVLSFM